MPENLWPADFGEMPVRTPLSILREQALALGQRTTNIVLGRVTSSSAGTGKFRHTFYIHCNPLGYMAPFLYVDHSIDLYPAELSVDDEEGPPSRAENAEDFVAKLQEIFSREKTKKMIASLIAQSK